MTANGGSPSCNNLRIAYGTMMIREHLVSIASLQRLWPDLLPEAERLIFVALPPEKQQLALKRLQAVREFQAGSGTPRALMERLQLGRTQFYKLLRDWKANKSLTSLVPHSKPAPRRAARVPPQVLELCRQVLAEHARRPIEDVPSETTIMREIQQRAAHSRYPVPADTSVRRMIARLSLEDANLQLSAVARGQKSAFNRKTEKLKPEERTLEFTQVFGGRLLVDHTTLDLVVTDGTLTFRPTISLVVDDATRLVLASRLVGRIPEPDDFLNILAFAAVGYQRLQEKGISAVPGLHPILTMRTGTSSRWSDLRALAELSRFKFDIRRAPEPVFGHLLRRSMMTGIGNLRFLPRATMHEPAARIRADDIRRAVVPWGDAGALLDVAVAEHNVERLKVAPDDVLRGSGRGANLRLNTERRDWLEYGLGIFRDAWASGL